MTQAAFAGGKTWTDERTALLRQLWMDGLPGGVIAKRMGLTRGMVTGKRHSLGLPPRTGEVARAAMALNGRRTAALIGHAGKASPELAAAKASAVDCLEALTRPLAGSSPRPLSMRAAGECVFPVAGYGAGTLSCCEPVEPGRGYCLGHVEILAGRPWPPVDPSPELAASQWAAA